MKEKKPGLFAQDHNNSSRDYTKPKVWGKNQFAYETNTDKAFALPGTSSHALLGCDELTPPRISKREIKNIILGGGQNFLSPERRFDAVLVNSPELFE